MPGLTLIPDTPKPRPVPAGQPRCDRLRRTIGGWQNLNPPACCTPPRCLSRPPLVKAVEARIAAGRKSPPIRFAPDGPRRFALSLLRCHPTSLEPVGDLLKDSKQHQQSAAEQAERDCSLHPAANAAPDWVELSQHRYSDPDQRQARADPPSAISHEPRV